MMRALFLIVLLLPLAAHGQITVTGASIDPRGWVMQLYVSGANTNGIINASLGPSNTISATTTIAVSGTSRGYDDSGTRIWTVGFTNWGTKTLRHPHPNSDVLAIKDNGSGNIVVPVALSDYVYSDDSNVVLTAFIGAYAVTNGTGTNSLGITNLSVTNLSTILHGDIPAIAYWVTPSRQLVGSNYQLTVFARHNSAQQGRPVRAVEFWAADAAGNRSTTNFVTTPSLFTNCNRLMLHSRITNDLYAGTPMVLYTNVIDGSGFAQFAVISNYVRVYPWRGDVLDFSDGVNHFDDWKYAPLLLYCNKSNLWKTAIAVVDPTNGVAAGRAVIDWSLLGEAVAFSNLSLAMNAAGATNSANNGTNTLENCFILCTNGAYPVFGGTVTTRNAPGTWTYIMPYPGVARSAVNLWTNITHQTVQKDVKLAFINLTFGWSNGVSMFSQGYGHLLFAGNEFQTNITSAGTVADFHTNSWHIANIYRKWRNGHKKATGIARSFNTIIGNIWYGFSDNAALARHDTHLYLGNLVVPTLDREQYIVKNDNETSQPYDPVAWCFNRHYRLDAAAYNISLGLGTHINKGFAFDQNLIEVSTNGSGIPFDVMESQNTTEYITNGLAANNTIIAVYHPPFELGNFTDRTLVMYSDKNNLYGDFEIRTDLASGAQDGDNTNRWARIYSVGSEGNVMTEIATASKSPPSLVEKGFDGLSSQYWDTNVSHFGFQTNASAYGGGSAVGLGYYKLSTNSAVRTFPVRTLIYPYDIEGNVRTLSDPPGAYSAPVIAGSGGAGTLNRDSDGFLRKTRNGLLYKVK